MMLSSQIMRDWKNHAKQCYPFESCGIITNNKYIPSVNVCENPSIGFKIDPVLISKINKIDMVLHTHIETNYPSKIDMQEQESMGTPWSIGYCPNGYIEDWFSWGDSLQIPPLKGRNYRFGITDCWTLIRDWFRLELGILLPIFPRDRNDLANGKTLFDQFGDADFVEVDNVKYPGDCMLFKMNSSIINHCGVLVSDEKFIHQPLTGVSRSSMVQLWNRKAVGFYRHKSMIKCQN